QPAHVGPNPGEPVFLEQADEMRPMPAWVAEFDRKAKIRRQLSDEIPEGRFLFLWRVRGRELNEDDAQLGRERLERAEKGNQLRAAIAQPPLVGDLARQLSGKAKMRRSHIHPTPSDRRCACAVKSRVDLDC